MSSLRKQAFNKGLPPLPEMGAMPRPDGSKASGPRKRVMARDYTPVPWSDFFEEKKRLSLESSDGLQKFNIYTSGQGSTGPLMVLLHGGGYSGLTWACFSKELSSMISCRIMAIDFRGHGDTCTSNDEDLSVTTLANDVKEIITEYCKDEEIIESINGIVLVGHSMGGAIAVHAAHLMESANVLGLLVIDVVEGSAMDALYSMQSFLQSRPHRFNSVEQGIEWCLRSGQTKNLEAARVSFPSQLVKIEPECHDKQTVDAHNGSVARPDELMTKVTGSKPSDGRTGEKPANDSPVPDGRAIGTKPEHISDSSEEPNATSHSSEGGFNEKADTGDGTCSYTWRIDLTKTERFWKGWFEGLSAKFLAVSAPKTLVLAGVDRLDKELTIGQMQGQFQMIVLPKVGHALHEDSPKKLAEVLATFCVRNKFATAKTEFSPVFPGC